MEKDRRTVRLLVQDGIIIANPLAKDSQTGISDIKNNRNGFNVFIVLSADLGTGGASVIFFHPHILTGIVGCQAIEFYEKVALEARLGASFKVMVYSKSRFITGEPGLTPGTPLPGGGEVPDWPFN